MKILISLFVFITIILVSQNQLSHIQKLNKYFYVPPPKAITHMHFGYKETFADSLWLRAIQDFDYCEEEEDQSQQKENHFAVENKSLLDDKFKSVLKTIEDQNKNIPTCKKGWVYQMLDTVTELSPRFKTAYLMGGTSLGVIVKDYEGASAILEKGMAQFPDDWRISYYAASHFLNDRQDLKKAAKYLEIAAEHGAPPWVNSLAARAYTGSGQAELAIRRLLAFREYTTGSLRDEVDQRIERLKKTYSEALKSEKK
ncbi:MAG: hypothetical protein KDD34_03080 [Bdellovibrionales bacterium]|nr:hypothetical protein [Bdellovibrionales bacterium]